MAVCCFFGRICFLTTAWTSVWPKQRKSWLLLWTLLTRERGPKAQQEPCPGKPPEGHLGLSLLLWRSAEEVCASLASAAGLKVAPQEYFCLYFRGWATSGLSAQEQAPKGIKPQYQDPCYRAGREKVKSFGSGLTLWLLRAPAGRPWGEAWGEMILNLKPTTAHMTSCRASPSLCFTFCVLCLIVHKFSSLKREGDAAFMFALICVLIEDLIFLSDSSLPALFCSRWNFRQIKGFS